MRSRRKGPGWEFVHVAIDDNSRIAFAKVMNSERRRSATAFLKAALAYYESLGIKVERVMTDNGSCYKSFAFRRLCRRLGLKHIRTKPYMPKTNGQAEFADGRFIIDAGMRSVPIVAVQPDLQIVGSLPRMLVGFCVSPLTQRGLDESFGLPAMVFSYLSWATMVA
jgi:hypothetical protein